MLDFYSTSAPKWGHVYGLLFFWADKFPSLNSLSSMGKGMAASLKARTPTSNSNATSSVKSSLILFAPAGSVSHILCNLDASCSFLWLPFLRPELAIPWAQPFCYCNGRVLGHKRRKLGGCLFLTFKSDCNGLVSLLGCYFCIKNTAYYWVLCMCVSAE